jgi:hypothetical protein
LVTGIGVEEEGFVDGGVQCPALGSVDGHGPGAAAAAGHGSGWAAVIGPIPSSGRGWRW